MNPLDGQQRLTTIFIILSCLDVENPYFLEYETRNDSKDFLANIDNSKKDENIDYNYIVAAKKTVKEWLSGKSEDFKSAFATKLKESVKFIWYESVDEDPIKVFTRLNIGKISLTNAELIKALFLNRSNFPQENYQHTRLRQQEIASEWDNIEYTLQNDEFWLFLNEKGYDKPTRIDMIFDLICEQNLLKLETETVGKIGTDEYKTFRYSYEYFKSEDASITDAWAEVKRIFQTFEEWFDDLELYHYVGTLCSSDYGCKISDLIKKWKDSQDKSNFKKEIIDLLKKEIKLPVGKYLCDEKHINDSLDYNDDKKLIKKILLLHNIQTIIKQNENYRNSAKYKLPMFQKFPFHHFKNETWNVEHIDSNTTNELDDKKQQKEWLQSACIAFYDTDDEDSELRIKINNFLNDKSEIDFKELNKEIMEKFSSENALNEVEKMKIWNLTFLDEKTNKGYHNDIFVVKRRRIIGKDQGNTIFVSETGEVVSKPNEIAFIPPVTKNVFLKYYTPVSNNLLDWDKDDARAYLQNIKDILKDFIEEQTNG